MNTAARQNHLTKPAETRACQALAGRNIASSAGLISPPRAKCLNCPCEADLDDIGPGVCWRCQPEITKVLRNESFGALVRRLRRGELAQADLLAVVAAATVVCDAFADRAKDTAGCYPYIEGKVGLLKTALEAAKGDRDDK